jgi:hypothetical protein
MPGHGRPADPLWTAIGFLIGVIPGIVYHQLGLGLCLGGLLGGAFGLIREDRKRGYSWPSHPLWFVVGLMLGMAGGVGLHYLGLSWPMGIGLGLALGLVLGAVAGTIRPDRRGAEERENPRFR